MGQCRSWSFIEPVLGDRCSSGQPLPTGVLIGVMPCTVRGGVSVRSGAIATELWFSRSSLLMRRSLTCLLVDVLFAR